MHMNGDVLDSTGATAPVNGGATATTAVIGGIYTRTNSESWNEVPILSRIPILGWLFKKKAVSDQRTELLIFITPHIINRSESSLSTSSDEPKQ